MGKVSIIKRPDGQLSISKIAREQRPDETDEEFMAAATEAMLVQWPDARVIGVFDETAVPTDRTFREAWAWLTPKPAVDIDMTKARQIHMGRIRQKRNEVLASSDGAMRRAEEAGTKSEVEELRAIRQKLRLIPQVYSTQLETAQTVEELKTIWPEELT